MLVRVLSIDVSIRLFNLLSPGPLQKIAAAIIVICFSYLGSKLRVFGLTGGIACGKSTVSSELIQHGWIVIDADKISREIMDKDEEL